MVLKWLIWILALFLVVLSVRAYTTVVTAQDAANYTTEYNNTNIYTTDGFLIYAFTGLDAAEDYVWLLQGIDESGVGFQALGIKFHSGGTTDTIIFTGQDFDRGDGTVYSGPARVIDNYGNELGRHYLLPGCFLPASTNCGPDGFPWILDGTATNPEDDRFIIGKLAHLEEINSEGSYFHPIFDQQVVMIPEGDHTFIHYRADIPGTDEYAIMNVNDPTVLYRFVIDDFITYNIDVRCCSVITSSQPENSFMVLNTNGEDLGFVNVIQADAAFNQPTSGDNPFTVSLPLGAFDYVRTDNVGAHVTDGESTLLISRGGTQEWGLSSNQDEVVVATNLNFELQSRTLQIFNSSYVNHTLEDSILGVLDTADYAFAIRRHDFFEVTGSPVSAQLDWFIAPTETNLQNINFADRRFEVQHTYLAFVPDVGETTGLQQRVENSISGIGLDTPFGRGIGLVFLILVGFMFLGRRQVRGIVPYGLTFIVIGGVWIGIGMSDTLTTLLFGVSAIILIFLMINARSNRSSV